MTGAFLCVRLPTSPTAEQLRVFLELVADLNAQWYLDEWAAGRMPPASPAAAGVRHQPDQRGKVLSAPLAPTLFAERIGSCGSIAAASVGQARAAELLAGRTHDEARTLHRIHLEPQGPRYWHALHATPSGLFDPSAECDR